MYFGLHLVLWDSCYNHIDFRQYGGIGKPWYSFETDGSALRLTSRKSILEL